jgi:hypothetical protein
MIGADKESICIFKLGDADTLDYCYTETGSTPRAACARLTRQR